MRSIIFIMLSLVISSHFSALGRTVKGDGLAGWARDYQIISPFLSCGPNDGCVDLPDVPPVWRFIPEFMSYRKFTPVGAIRKDWNDWWLSRRRTWWDYTYNLAERAYFNNGFNTFTTFTGF